jgi:hypothetical protein
MNEEKENTKSLEQEREELNMLVNRGVPFEVRDFDVVKKPVLFGLFKKKVLVPVVRKFKVDEPTLGTLDRLSREWIEFAIDEAKLQSDDGMKEARTMAGNHALRCAKIVAIAVLGEDYLVPVPGRNGVVKYVEDVKRLDELTALFARSIKPSKLYQLYTLINVMCNLGDFLNSIRLMSSDRTSMPIRIEENNGV